MNATWILVLIGIVIVIELYGIGRQAEYIAHTLELWRRVTALDERARILRDEAVAERERRGY